MYKAKCAGFILRDIGRFQKLLVTETFAYGLSPIRMRIARRSLHLLSTGGEQCRPTERPAGQAATCMIFAQLVHACPTF